MWNGKQFFIIFSIILYIFINRFQDDDDIFGLKDDPPKPAAGKKTVEDDSMDWLEMATGGKTPEKTPAKQAEPQEQKPVDTKPVTPPSKSTKASDWLGLKSDDEEEEYDFLKASSFSAPARQGQPFVNIFEMILYGYCEELELFLYHKSNTQVFMHPL